MAGMDSSAKKPVKPQEKGKLSEQLDRDLAARAYRKVMQQEQPTAQEQAALRRHEKQQEEKRRWEYYESISQKHWRQMSGRQTKILKEQAERYALPFGERSVNLPKLVRALHDFLARNAHKLASEDDDLMQGSVSSPALEKYREERAIMARYDRLEREGSLIPREELRDGLGRIAAILRTAGQTLQKQFGEEAAEILLDALDEATREINQLEDAETNGEEQT